MSVCGIYVRRSDHQPTWLADLDDWRIWTPPDGTTVARVRRGDRFFVIRDAERIGGGDYCWILTTSGVTGLLWVVNLKDCTKLFPDPDEVHENVP